jgi:transcription elongation factor GreA
MAGMAALVEALEHDPATSGVAILIAQSRDLGGRAMTTIASALSDHEFALTRAGYERLRDELAMLTTVSRAESSDRIRGAREHGEELADNSDLIGALEAQESLERRITTLEAALASSRVVDSPRRDGTIGIGTCVQLLDLDSSRTVEYEVVGSVEADPVQRRLSAKSPVGRALLGRRAGEVVEAEAPVGRMRFRVLAARPAGETPSTASGRVRPAGVLEVGVGSAMVDWGLI